MVHTSPSPSPSWQWDPLVRSFPVSSPDLTDLLSGEHVSAVWALSLPPMPALEREALSFADGKTLLGLVMGQLGLGSLWFSAWGQEAGLCRLIFGAVRAWQWCFLGCKV